MEEQRTEQIEKAELLPKGYTTVERGVRLLSRSLVWLPNIRGGIREGAVLEPLNEKSKRKFLNLLHSELKEVVEERKSVRFNGTNIKAVEKPLSEIVKGYKKYSSHFLTEYLEERHSGFKDGILVVHADTKNFVSPKDVYLFGLTIVENEPSSTLQDFCKGHNLKLLFLFDERDATKYPIWMTIAPGVRPMSLKANMVDTAQINNPEEFIDSRRVPNEVKSQWYDEVHKLTSTVA